jgi:hypothetical protein
LRYEALLSQAVWGVDFRENGRQMGPLLIDSAYVWNPMASVDTLYLLW